VIVQQDDRVAFWQFEDLGLFLGAIIPSFLVATLLLRLGRYLAPSVFGNQSIQTLVFQAIIYGLLLGALYCLIAIRYGMPFWSSLGWTMNFQGAWLCVAAAPVLAIGSSLIAALLRAPTVSSPIEDLLKDRQSRVVIILFVTLLGPIFEELVFRGFLLPLLARALGSWPGILLAALPFALLHGQQNQWAWQILLSVGIAGVAFGYARERTGSTAAAALLHIGYNTTLMAAALAQRI
jgi:hypothetical protein